MNDQIRIDRFMIEIMDTQTVVSYRMRGLPMRKQVVNPIQEVIMVRLLVNPIREVSMDQLLQPAISIVLATVMDVVLILRQPHINEENH